MTQTGGKRKINPTLRAWIQHVRAVAKSENLPYGKEAMKKAKQGKYGQQWKAISASVKKGGSNIGGVLSGIAGAHGGMKGQKGGIYNPFPMATKGVSPSSPQQRGGADTTMEEEGTTTSESMMEETPMEDMTDMTATGTATMGGRRRRTRRGSRSMGKARSMRRGRAAARGRSRARY
jgi:hypothetical protein